MPSNPENLLAAIYDNICRGLAMRAFFQCQSERHEEISSKMGKRGYVHVYNLLTSSLQTELLLCLTRIWDKSSDAQSFINLKMSVDWDRLELPIVNDRWEQERRAAREEFEAHVDAFPKSDQFKALLVSRAEGFAHSVPVSRERQGMTEPRPAQFRDLYDVLDRSVEVYNKFDLAHNSNTTAFEFLEQEFSGFSKVFFDHVPDLQSKN